MSTSRIDPHVKVLDESIVERAADRGIDAVVYAPHFTRLPEIERRARALSTEDVLVAPAREVFTGTYQNRKHVLALGLDEPVPDFISLEAAMAEFERQDATVLAPHPEYLTVGLSEADLWKYADRIDAIEVYNPKYLPGHGPRSRSIATELDLPAFGSSYAHLGWTVGDVWTETAQPVAADRRPEDDQDPDCSEHATTIAHALTDAGNRVSRRSGVGQRLRSASEIGHLAWENTWKKIDRIGFPGMEDTHPHDDLYDGRFDDAYVY
ncbi:PHP domain-containing protein [Salinarchaeum laminariae]|uniref:PHP domain-containing protein n=1 Tax=Salinarchaeum laminariae TaxID=869888 RepID=UPI0020C1814F|nr:PHP-associated domain-containing protein [Salinarchaeum laminariae]